MIQWPGRKKLWPGFFCACKHPAPQTASTKTGVRCGMGLKARPIQSGGTSTSTSATVESALAKLRELGNERMRAQNRRNGAGENQFGVRLGEIRTLAKAIKIKHELAMELWDTENVEARLLATLGFNPKALSSKELDRLVRGVTFVQVADWLGAYVVKRHADHEALRQEWMTSDHPYAARAGWSLTSQRVAKQAVAKQGAAKNSEALDLDALLDRIESEMATAPALVQWTMNFCLAEIGINFETHRGRALAIGEALGIYRDYPVSKGCTSPFAPIWIHEIVRRRG